MYLVLVGTKYSVCLQTHVFITLSVYLICARGRVEKEHKDVISASPSPETEN